MDNKYQKSKIYAIKSHLDNKYYIGSTIQQYLCRRLGSHKTKYNYFINNRIDSHYVTSFELIEKGDAYIELIENYPCNNKLELYKRERYWIELNQQFLYNKIIPSRTAKEYVALPRRRENHRQHANEKIICDICNLLYSRANISLHKKIHNI